MSQKQFDERTQWVYDERTFPVWNSAFDKSIRTDMIRDDLWAGRSIAVLLAVRQIKNHLMAPQKLLNLVERARCVFRIALLVVALAAVLVRPVVGRQGRVDAGGACRRRRRRRLKLER